VHALPAVATGWGCACWTPVLLGSSRTDGVSGDTGPSTNR
jgi:hypothetical protein